MKKPIGIIVNDVHLNHDNVEDVVDIMQQLIKSAKKMDIKSIFILGDFFHNRSMQRLVTLKAAAGIFKQMKDEGFNVYVIAGNHDKTDYKSSDSFLDIFGEYENVTVCDENTGMVIDGVSIAFLPFYHEDMLVDILDAIPDADILMSHFETEGVVPHDDADVFRAVPVEKLKRFKLVLLGHIHNSVKIDNHIYQLPATRQNTFGEDEKKGFTVVYNDLTLKHIQSKFTKFKTVVLDIKKDDVNEVFDKLNSFEGYKRVIIKGNDKEIAGFDKDRFAAAGIRVKINKKVNNNKVGSIKIKSKDVFKMFNEFCDERNLDYETGIKYLKV